jgi:purine nucleosidase
MHRIIIDTDPGVDDAHAILMALAHPDARVEAIMTVAGNVGLEHTTANACTILDVAGADAPVYAGCAGPVIPRDHDDAAHVHGDDGLGGANFPPSPRRVEAEHAAAALVRLANAEPGAFTLVAIGPLTNLAAALLLDPALPQKIGRLVVMGGAIRSMGNTANVSAEFNFYSDPEAAYRVLNAWPELTLVSWETTMAHGFGSDLLEKWWKLGTARSEFFRKTNERVVDYIFNVLGRRMLFGADALAMAVALEPEIIRTTEKHFVTVELAGEKTRGQSVVDWFNLTKKPANANLILEVDYDRFISLMEQGLA